MMVASSAQRSFADGCLVTALPHPAAWALVKPEARALDLPAPPVPAGSLRPAGRAGSTAAPVRHVVGCRTDRSPSRCSGSTARPGCHLCASQPDIELALLFLRARL